MVDKFIDSVVRVVTSDKVFRDTSGGDPYYRTGRGLRGELYHFLNIIQSRTINSLYGQIMVNDRYR
jgi:hypothetical protein